MEVRVSEKAQRFTESVIREMTRVCEMYGGINLAQGFPDFPAPQIIKDAACKAIQDDVNQYAITWGAKSLRDAISRKYARTYGLEIDPEREITVCCGATETMMSAMMAVVSPGDEVIVFEPFYENYGPDAILSGATPRFITLKEPDWTFDRDELARAFNKHTRAIIINTPNNPTGKVFSRDELSYIAQLCQEWNAVAITDEIYEHLVYHGEHISMATLPGMRDRTITISGCSKTYSVTGWRVGYAIAAEPMTNAIRKVHDFLTVGAPAPLQEAAAVALDVEDEYYRSLLRDYRERRDFMLEALTSVGFPVYVPNGAYYVMVDIRPFGYDDDVEFAHHLVKEVGVATVPGSSFYHDPKLGSTKVRFSFPKKMSTLSEAARRLGKLNR